MKRKYRLIIEAIGFLIILLLGVSIIQDILILIFKEINRTLFFFIRFGLAIVLIYIMTRFTNFGKDLDNFLIETADKFSKRMKK